MPANNVQRFREALMLSKAEVVLADRRDGKPVRRICVLSHDGQELKLHDLMWIRPDGERVSIPAAIKTAAE